MNLETEELWYLKKLPDKAMVKHKLSIERKRFTMYNIKATPVSASASALQAAEEKFSKA
jgi:hypothetical protein